MDEDPRAKVRSSASRLREIADQLEGCARQLAATLDEDDRTHQIVTDASVHVRLTAEALDYTI